MTDVVAKYLSRDSVDDPAASEMVDRAYDAVVVVPARAEDPSFVDALGLESVAGEVLLVVVVNGRENDGDDVTAQNRRLVAGLCARGLIAGQTSTATWITGRMFDLLLLDRATPGRRLGPRQGVGQARRIGLDTGLRLWHRGRLQSDWLHTTDADATLPATHLRMPEGAVARMASWWHETGDDSVGRATALYEVWLRYYVAGLRWAGSPWAHHSIGSCISVRAHAYAVVRGVPDRQAGEDFHLLAKLAKVGYLARGSDASVRLRARQSNRVPFGTGPAVTRLMAGEPLRLHDPRVFVGLREVQVGLKRLSEEFERTGAVDPTRALAMVTGDDPLLVAALERIGFGAGIFALATQGPPSLRALREWFDARRTLRFIHALRDLAWPPLPWRDALQAAPFFHGATGEVDEVRRRLAEMEWG